MRVRRVFRSERYFSPATADGRAQPQGRAGESEDRPGLGDRNERYEFIGRPGDQQEIRLPLTVPRKLDRAEESRLRRIRVSANSAEQDVPRGANGARGS